MRGNFWKIMGYTTKKDRKQCLNPEEALLLVERSQLLVRPANARSGPHIASQHFYEEALHFLPQAAVLTYNKVCDCVPQCACVSASLPPSLKHTHTNPPFILQHYH